MSVIIQPSDMDFKDSKTIFRGLNFQGWQETQEKRCKILKAESWQRRPQKAGPSCHLQNGGAPTGVRCQLTGRTSPYTGCSEERGNGNHQTLGWRVGVLAEVSCEVPVNPQHLWFFSSLWAGSHGPPLLDAFGKAVFLKILQLDYFKKVNKWQAPVNKGLK